MAKWGSAHRSHRAPHGRVGHWCIGSASRRAPMVAISGIRFCRPRPVFGGRRGPRWVPRLRYTWGLGLFGFPAHLSRSWCSHGRCIWAGTLPLQPYRAANAGGGPRRSQPSGAMRPAQIFFLIYGMKMKLNLKVIATASLFVFAACGGGGGGASTAGPLLRPLPALPQR